MDKLRYDTFRNDMYVKMMHYVCVLMDALCVYNSRKLV